MKNKGLSDFWERIIGKRRKTEENNRLETYEAAKRDQTERDALIWSQLEKLRLLQQQIVHSRSFAKQHSQKLKEDIRKYDEIRFGN